jgi:hypothetical protein
MQIGVGYNIPAHVREACMLVKSLYMSGILPFCQLEPSYQHAWARDSVAMILQTDKCNN